MDKVNVNRMWDEPTRSMKTLVSIGLLGERMVLPLNPTNQQLLQLKQLLNEMKSNSDK